MICLQYAKDYFLDHHSTHILNSRETSPEALDYHDKKAVDEQLTLNTSDLLTKGSGVVFEGERYSVGDVVELNLYNVAYLFGLVKSALAFREQISLACARLVTECFVSHFNAYKFQEAGVVSLHSINQFLDYHPLGLYNISQSTFVCLRHYISVPV